MAGDRSLSGRGQARGIVSRVGGIAVSTSPSRRFNPIDSGSRARDDSKESLQSPVQGSVKGPVRIPVKDPLRVPVRGPVRGGAPVPEAGPVRSGSAVAGAGSSEVQLAGADLANGVLERIRTRLTSQVGPQRFERYFDRQARLTVTANGVDVTVSSRFMAELLDRQFGAVLREVIRVEWPMGSKEHAAASGEGTSEGGTEVAADADHLLHYRVDSRAFGGAGSAVEDRDADEAKLAENGGGARSREAGRDRDASENGSAALAASARVRARSRGGERSASGVANGAAARFRFETFVVGMANRLAYSAAVKIAESSDAREFNRVFIQGPCGLGKTHLLHATLARFKELNPTAVVRYTTAEDFTNEYITAVRANKIDAFRKQYRRVDLLCLDDVHFFSKKDKTQGELQHTFDALDLDGARLVLASDELPREIASLSEQLVSRFLSGAVVRLDPPERELRERLVKAIAARRGLSVDDGAAAALAQHRGSSSTASVRELEGAMVQVEAMLRLSGSSNQLGGGASSLITASLVHRTLGGGGVGVGGGEKSSAPLAAAVRSGRPIPFQIVIAEVCRELNVDVAAFAGTGRHPRVVLARCICGHLGRELTTLSFPEIARHMSRPTHSTIISGCKRLRARLSDEESSQADLSGEFGAEFAGLTLAALLDRIIRAVVRGAEKS